MELDALDKVRVRHSTMWGPFVLTSDASSSSSSGGRRIATLNDISSGGPPVGGGHGHAHGDDDDEEDEDEGPGDQGADWYAGGERRYVVCLPMTPVPRAWSMYVDRAAPY